MAWSASSTKTAEEVASRATSAMSRLETSRMPVSLMAPILVARVDMRASRRACAMVSAAAAAISSSRSRSTRASPSALPGPACTESTPTSESPASSGSEATSR